MDLLTVGLKFLVAPPVPPLSESSLFFISPLLLSPLPPATSLVDDETRITALKLSFQFGVASRRSSNSTFLFRSLLQAIFDNIFLYY